MVSTVSHIFSCFSICVRKMYIEKYLQDFIYSYESRLAHGTSTAEAECLLILLSTTTNKQ